MLANSGVYFVRPDTDEGVHPLRLNCTLRGDLRKTFPSPPATTRRRVLHARRHYVVNVVAIGDRVRLTQLDAQPA